MTKFKLSTVILAVAAVFVGGNSFAETKVSGFVDAGYNWTNKSAGSVATRGNSFNVNDAAVYLSHENDGWSLMADLDFTWAAGAFAMGAKGQAYVMKQYNSGLWWRLGRFDRIWGHESVDSIDRSFIRGAAIYANAANPAGVTPAVGFGANETGVSLGYDFDPITFEILVSNGSNSTGNVNKNYGGKLGFKSDMFHLGFAYIRDGNTATSLIDILAGVALGNFTIDLEAVIIDTTNSQFDIGAWFVYDFTEAWDFAARFEYLSSPGGTATGTAWALNVGPQYSVTKNTTLKAEVNFGSFTAATGATSVSPIGISVAAQHRM